MYSVTINQIIKKFNIENITPDIDCNHIKITQSDVNRPALQLAGYFDYFDAERVQIIGRVEYTYLKRIEKNKRKQILDKLFKFHIPCLILCRDLDPFPEMLTYANKYKVPILKSKDTTSEFMSELIRWLKVELAPRMSVHGVLVDIFGEGVLIMGESGVGKSEAALELIKRGHRLVADDVVEIKKVSNQTLIGSSPEVIRHFIELRGIGVVDVKELYGVESVEDVHTIDLVIKMELWDDTKEYDRLGLTEEYIEILGNKVVCHSIPIRPGRNLAIICETAAVNHRQKKMGYNAAEELNDRITKNLKKKKQEEEN
ncbi:HPr(Ser) kinase/phosphatase [Defluviitalea phaphyphila]|uniref:HPr(Ser) kinase/phosphatase n=1 Tax=Defluviitalea phaphyphila TaxID=1473580 RepID=UPI0007307E46|nr:HPr(Ser) kinase/phosphatase [Defluviitalea phaphyphila]